MILKEIDLTLLFQQKENNLNISLNDQKILSLKSLELFIENIHSFLDPIKQNSKIHIFDNLYNISIYTTLQGFDYALIPRLTKFLAGNQRKLDKLSLNINDNARNYQKFKYSQIDKISETVELNEKHLEEMKALSSNLNIIYIDSKNSYKYQLIPSNKIDFSKQLLELKNKEILKETSSYNKLITLFQNIAHLNFGQQFDNTNLSDIHDFLSKQISSLKSVQVLKLQFQFKIIPDHLLERYSFVQSILQLPVLVKLELTLEDHLARFIINQFNQIESKVLEDSSIETISLFFKTVRSPLYMSYQNPINLEFLRNFRSLRNLSVLSKYQPIQNLDKIFHNIDCSLQSLILDIKIFDTHLDSLTQSLNHHTNNIHTLNLKYRQIKFTHSKAQFTILPKEFFRLSNLQVLNVNTNEVQIIPNQLLFIGQSFKFLSQLTEFSFFSSNQSFSDSEFIGLVSGFQELTKLKRLKLGFEKENEIGNSGMFSLAESICCLSNLKYLKLVINSQRISREGTLRIQQALKSLKSQPRAFLDLIDYETIILQYMKLTGPTLAPLFKKRMFEKISYNTKVSPSVLPHLFYFPHLIYNNGINYIDNLFLWVTSKQVTQFGYEKMQNALVMNNNLKKLYLSFDNIQFKVGDMKIIAETLEKLPQLNDFQLRCQKTQIECNGVYQLYQSISKLQNLEILYLNLTDYYEINGDNNFLKGLKNLKTFFIQPTLHYEVLFEYICCLPSLRNLILLRYDKQNQSQDNYQKYFQLLSSLQLHHLCVWIDRQDIESSLSFTLKNFSRLTTLGIETTRTFVNTIQLNRIKQDIFKMKRLVQFTNLNYFN